MPIVRHCVKLWCQQCPHTVRPRTPRRGVLHNVSHRLNRTIALGIATICSGPDLRHWLCISIYYVEHDQWRIIVTVDIGTTCMTMLSVDVKSIKMAGYYILHPSEYRASSGLWNLGGNLKTLRWMGISES